MALNSISNDANTTTHIAAFERNLLSWLSPHEYKDVLERHLELKMEGTCEWLFCDERFKS